MLMTLAVKLPGALMWTRKYNLSCPSYAVWLYISEVPCYIIIKKRVMTETGWREGSTIVKTLQICVELKS